MKYKCLVFSYLVFLLKTLPAQITHPFFQNEAVFIQIDNENQWFFKHNVTKNQTIYSISKLYGLTTPDLLKLNPEYQNIPLQEFAILKIPFFVNRLYYQLPVSDKSGLPVFYTVEAKENLFHICKRKLNLNPNHIASINNLNIQQLKAGQNLFLGYLPIQANIIEENNPDITPEVDTFHFTHHSRGVALSESNSLGTGRYFALHNKAPLESYIEIINPILELKVIAKVIGRIPPIYENDIQLIVSAEVARKLSVLNKRFFAYINYK